MSEDVKDTAIAVRDTAPTGLAVNEINTLSEAFYKSGMFIDIKSAAQAMVKIVAGQELGLGPVYSMTKLYLLDGKLGMAAETMAALLKKSGRYNYRVIDHTDQRCVIEFSENGAKVYTSTFTIADATKAGLIKPNGGWVKYPRAMLFSRALSQGARIVAPDAIGGAYTEEELRNIKLEGAWTPGETSEETPVEGEIVSDEVPSSSDEDEVHPWTITCPEHDVPWSRDSYGNLSHKTEEVNEKGKAVYCKISKVLWAYFTQPAKDAGYKEKEAVDEWLKRRFGVTWSKLNEEQMIRAIQEMTDLALAGTSEE